MQTQRWAPRVTVAAIAERNGRFLLVEEHTADGLRLNQPAGHLEPGESLLEAVAREALEETACRFIPEALVGVYLTHLTRAGGGVDYLRFAYCGAVSEPEPGRRLDPAIVRRVWLTPDELRASAARHRTSLVRACVDDYLAGRRFPLDLVQTQSHAPLPGA